MEFCLGVTWLALDIPDDGALDRASAEFEVANGDPCLWWDHPGSRTLHITWDVQITETHDPYEAAMLEARTVVTERLTRAGVAGRILDASAATDEGSATWTAAEEGQVPPTGPRLNCR